MSTAAKQYPARNTVGIAGLTLPVQAKYKLFTKFDTRVCIAKILCYTGSS